MEKYSRGRRGAPAKGVGRVYRRESSNLSFSAKNKAYPNRDMPYFYRSRDLIERRFARQKGARDVFERRRGRKKREKRSGSGQNLASVGEQQILGTATVIKSLQARSLKYLLAICSVFSLSKSRIDPTRSPYKKSSSFAHKVIAVFIFL